MAISIAWGTKIINVPKADLSVVQMTPTEILELDIDDFRLALKALESSSEGMPFLRTHNHTREVTFGDVTLAEVVEIINGYTVTFEDGEYAVNLTGANSNISDVSNVNSVSIRASNSAGLQIVTVSGGFTTADRTALELARDHARAANSQTQAP